MYLYKIDSADVKNRIREETVDLVVREFAPSLRGGLFLKEEEAGVKAAAVRLMFQIMTLGKTRIYYVKRENTIIHTSYAIPACARFPFMGRDDLEIGPCFTHPAFRGKGIYSRVLSEICQRKSTDISCFYMIVKETNISSIHGIEKAGFVRCGTVHKNKFSKRYNLVS